MSRQIVVRIVGLPLLLWEKYFFNLMGDACGGLFGGIDEGITAR